ncbi:MAG: sulfurtransferase [Candidatus Eisenbacteria bacterium]|uniref:Sulfurtransferase n=1 Tax=Eiseniibacteriota bacterium TaxID=2212470 RepID=A0A849SNX3_UNCEI|nr:sulfurtransferase [Candidatus Eisenbacteria bacterium]
MSNPSTVAPIASRGYARPDVLVTTEWVADHLTDPTLRIVESNEDSLLYPSNHIPGAVQVDWAADLNDPVRRDYLDRASFESLMARIGVTRETTVVFYGDKNNWWACYAFWVFQLFGHSKARVMDGGRLKWEQEKRAMTREVPSYAATSYAAPERDDRTIRAFRDQVLAHATAGLPMVDVRSPQEFSGERTHMAEYPQEGVLRGGHIPGAKSVPWARAMNTTDGTFKTADELRAIYEGEIGLKAADDVVAYCRIGERSSLTWFVLTYLLGYAKVRNYDGSWTEWGNSVGLPIEKG